MAGKRGSKKQPNNNDIQFEYYEEPKAVRTPKPKPMTATFTTQLITLKNIPPIYTAETLVVLSHGSRGNCVFIQIEPADEQKPGTTYKCGVSKSGNICVKCKKFNKDIISERYETEIPAYKGSKGLQCEITSVDEETKTVMIQVR